MVSVNRPVAPLLAVAVVVLSSVLGLAATDLVLPAVPTLPAALNGAPAQAQLVLAAFALGNGLGLLLFGALGSRYDQRWLLAGSLLLFAVLTLLASVSQSLPQLIGMRLLQGVSAAAGPVFAPGIIRALFSPQGAMRAIGVLGSVESLAPALAPVAGVWLLAVFGWRSSFYLLGIVAVVLAAVVWILRSAFPPLVATANAGSYLRLLRSAVFLRYALTQALTLGGLLVFVFGAPMVITQSLGGSINDFIVMQVSGITSFILAANLASRLAARFGAEPVIFSGTLISAGGALAILVYSFVYSPVPSPIEIAADDSSTLLLTLLFVPMNLGLGLRGPPGFYRAIIAAEGDDARGSALVILFVLLIAAFGTALVAPWIDEGLRPLMIGAASLSVASVAVLLLLPALPADAESA